MDEKKLAELIRTVVREEVRTIVKEEVRTIVKEEVRVIFKEEIRAIVKEEIKELIKDVDILKQKVIQIEQDIGILKQDIGILKHDVGILKHDVVMLKGDVGVLKQEVAEIKQEMATKAELMSMEQRFTASLEKLREALRLSMLEVHSDLEDIKVKLKMYDFDFLLKQNDYLAGVLKDLLEERKALSQRMKDFESRLKALEVA